MGSPFINAPLLKAGSLIVFEEKVRHGVPVSDRQDISGLGLRHVGYAIPPELFGPFVGSAVEMFSLATTNETAIDGFKWAMQLVSKLPASKKHQFPGT